MRAAPFWKRRNLGSWSIPKGEYDCEKESAFEAAKRELQEETGIVASGEFFELGTFVQPSGKLVSAWATENDFDSSQLRSNDECRIGWPPRSGYFSDVPEIDRVHWFSVDEALTKIVKGQIGIVQVLVQRIGEGEPKREPSAD
ncbi:NUDIX domain-containing protein [Methylosinus sp. Ce-a6]|uniref:NUDIX domain-containing protein n=1 Tax=Methylosinus sp. Ce-a6 TaxID=2172005 RepID=UPI00278BE2E5|nr:NUDIX domain-containing protein [Methylosinus sp. Ce-a6]